MRAPRVLGALLAMGAAVPRATAAAQQVPNLTATPSSTVTPSPTQTPTPSNTPIPPTPMPTPWASGSAEFTVNESSSYDEVSPRVAIGAQNGFIVTWTKTSPSQNFGIFARRFDKAGNPLGGDFQVNTSTSAYVYIPSIASDSAGNFVVVWASATGSDVDVAARRFDSNGNPLSGEFLVNSYTTGYQMVPKVAMSDAGFIVVWQSTPAPGQLGQDGDGTGIYAQRYSVGGVPNGGEFRVNAYTTGDQQLPSIAMSSERAVIAWASTGQNPASDVYARQFDVATGDPIGGELLVNTSPGGAGEPEVAMRATKDFVVVWSAPDGSEGAIFGRGWNPIGDPLGPQFRVSTRPIQAPARPRAAMASPFNSEGNGFVVAWDGAPDSSGEWSVRAQRYNNAPFPTSTFYLVQPQRRGEEYRVETVPTDSFPYADLAIAPDGQFVVAWDALRSDGSRWEVAARRFDSPKAAAMVVDQHPGGGASNLNGVLEPGERVVIEPSWRNPDADPLPLLGAGSNVIGPAGAAYTLDDSVADYATIASGFTKDCHTATGNCYEVTVSGTRPAQHWDATFDEDLDSPSVDLGAIRKTWALHVGGSFADVPQDGFYPFVENLFHNRVTAGGGCGAGLYCGDDGVLRQQMAVFLLKAANGAGFTPPPATGAVFADVPVSSPFAPWIEELARIGVTAGCNSPPPPALPSYCPTDPVNRQQMSVFLIKAWFGSNINPAGCNGIYDDVDCATNPFAPWIELLTYYQIAGGCQANPPLYCPTDPTKRKQMAVFLVKTFGLLLYGPD